jgi:hypothetical protein
MASPELRARILDATRSVPSPTRKAARRNAWLVLPCAAVVAAAIYYAAGGPGHDQIRPVLFYSASVLSWAAIAALSSWGALARGGSPLGRSRAWLVAVALGTPALLFALSFVLSRFPELGPDPDHKWGRYCFPMTLATAALPLVALAILRKHTDPVHPIASGAALGAACGASAGIMVEMWCPVASLRHLTLGHVAPVLVCIVVGAVLGARVIAMRGRK